MAQHLGKPSRPIVKKGDIITEGQLIGEKDGMFSSHIHSSIPGKVVDVGNYSSINSLATPAVVIQLEGELKKGNDQQTDWKQLNSDQIIQRVALAGIVGLGGACFPTDMKLSVPSGKMVDTLIINGVECEPYLNCDYRIMIEKTSEVLEGIRIIKKALNVKRVFIGIELNKKKAIRQFIDTAGKDDITIVPLRVRYPQGGEKQLIKAVIKKEVPSGGLPFDVGVVVCNVGTAFAVREAVLFQRPLTERTVTVTGTIVKKTGNYKMKIGTLLQDVIEEVGLTEEAGKIIFGGPMMGVSVISMDTPVTKGTCGILFLSKKEAKKINYNRFESCLHCSRCLMFCPIRLNPAMLSILSEKERYDSMSRYDIMDCIECGCCNYVCPSHRPIVQLIKMGKLNIKK